MAATPLVRAAPYLRKSDAGGNYPSHCRSFFHIGDVAGNSWPPHHSSNTFVSYTYTG